MVPYTPKKLVNLAHKQLKLAGSLSTIPCNVRMVSGGVRVSMCLVNDCECAPSFLLYGAQYKGVLLLWLLLWLLAWVS